MNNEYRESTTRSYNGTPCHDSIYSPNDGGHAVIVSGGKSKYHHIVVWERFNGPLPRGRLIHHLCYNKRCINRDHLKCVSWGHHSRLHNQGSSNPRAILNEEQVIELRELKKQFPGITFEQFAKALNMSASHLAAICRPNPEKWSHI